MSSRISKPPETTLRGADGTVYTGETLNNLPHGEGTLTSPDQVVYKGSFFRGDSYGHGTVTRPHGGGSLTGEFVNGTFLAEKKHIGHPFFVNALLGTTPYGTRLGFCEGVILHFLKDHPEYATLARSLEEMLSVLQAPPESKSTLVADKLRHLNINDSILLPYGSQTHAMGLRITKLSDQKFAFDLFNSGRGLEKYHPYTEFFDGKLKYQTQKRYLVPSSALTPDLIDLISHPLNFQNIDKAYYPIWITAIDSNPYDESNESVDPSHDLHTVWQSMQKSGNCQLEWVMAWLKNTSPSRAFYTRLRLKLFQQTLAAAEEQNTLTEANRKELLRKIHKRILDWYQDIVAT